MRDASGESSFVQSQKDWIKEEGRKGGREGGREGERDRPYLVQQV